MEIKKDKHINFLILLAIFFVFFTLVWLAIDKNGFGSGIFRQNNALYDAAKDDQDIAKKFGLGGKVEVRQDAVLGEEKKWANEDHTLTVNKMQVVYKKNVLDLTPINDSKYLQDVVADFVNGRQLVVGSQIDYQKSKYLTGDNGEFEETDIKKAKVLEVVFVDSETGQDTVRARITGNGEIVEILLIRS